MNVTIPEYFAKFDAIIAANNGYFVNGKLSWVDIYFTSFADYFLDLLKNAGVKTDVDFFEKFQNLTNLKNKILAIKGIKEWVAKRPITVA